MGCETVPRIPLWEAIYAHHRPQAPHCHFPPKKASSCHDRCETPAICIVLDWFRSQDRVVVVDAHSKWPEVISVSSTTSSSTIEVLRDLFARFGIHEQIQSKLSGSTTELFSYAGNLGVLNYFSYREKLRRSYDLAKGLRQI